MQEREKQIEELTNDLVFTNCYGTLNAVAIYLYDKGYRKQTNGEWIETDDENGYESSRCSKCGCEQVRKSYYCPDCGANMKGGE